MNPIFKTKLCFYGLFYREPARLKSGDCTACSKINIDEIIMTCESQDQKSCNNGVLHLLSCMLQNSNLRCDETCKLWTKWVIWISPPFILNYMYIDVNKNVLTEDIFRCQCIFLQSISIKIHVMIEMKDIRLINVLSFNA